MNAFLFALVLVAAQPMPDDYALSAANKGIASIYAADLARARSPERKSALAAEMLTDAEKVQDDPAGLYALLTKARDLAVEAGDPDTALECVRAIVAGFQAEGRPSAVECFEQAQMLWKQAGRAASKRQQLAGRIVAAEWYMRAKEAGAKGIVAQSCDDRLAEIRGGEKDKGKTNAADVHRFCGVWKIINIKLNYTTTWMFAEDGSFWSEGKLQGRWRQNDDNILVTWNSNPKAWVRFTRPIKTQMECDDWMGEKTIRATKID